MKYKVGLTGGIGSGKSTVANFFAELGIGIIDADVIAREVVLPGSEGLNALVKIFGDAILLADGALNRGYLRQLMFTPHQEGNYALKQVNAILHPLIQQRTQEQIDSTSSPYIVWVVPLLFENKLNIQAQRVLVVDVPEEIQIRRTVQRDGVTIEQVQKILDAQVSRKQRLELADDVINGDRTLKDVKHDVELLHMKYLTLASQYNNY